MVVSVLPVIIEEIFPISESGPYVFIISFRSINEDDDEIGLKTAIGNISFGKMVILIWLIRSVRILLLTKTVTAKIIENIEGKMFRDIERPSLTPSKNSS